MQCAQSTYTPTRLKCQLKVLQDSDFRINLDMDVRRIAPKMLWIHYLVGVGHFSTFHKSRLVTVSV